VSHRPKSTKSYDGITTKGHVHGACRVRTIIRRRGKTKKSIGRRMKFCGKPYWTRRRRTTSIVFCSMNGCRSTHGGRDRGVTIGIPSNVYDADKWRRIGRSTVFSRANYAFLGGKQFGITLPGARPAKRDTLRVSTTYDVVERFY